MTEERKPLADSLQEDLETPEGQYLVKRLDGTIVEWPNFVLGAEDPAAPVALRAYAFAALARGMNAQYVAGIRRLADQFDQYRTTQGEADPYRGRKRKEDPVRVEQIRIGRSA